MQSDWLENGAKTTHFSRRCGKLDDGQVKVDISNSHNFSDKSLTLTQIFLNHFTPGIIPHDNLRVDSGLSGSQSIGVIGPPHTLLTLTLLPMCLMELLDMC